MVETSGSIFSEGDFGFGTLEPIFVKKVTMWLNSSKEKGVCVYILQLIVKEQEDFHVKRNTHGELILTANRAP